jgi:hypothetical protein
MRGDVFLAYRENCRLILNVKTELSIKYISRIEKLRGDHGCGGKARGNGGEVTSGVSILRDRKSEFEVMTIFVLSDSGVSKVD